MFVISNGKESYNVTTIIQSLIKYENCVFEISLYSPLSDVNRLVVWTNAMSKLVKS